MINSRPFISVLMIKSELEKHQTQAVIGKLKLLIALPFETNLMHSVELLYIVFKISSEKDVPLIDAGTSG